MSLRQIGDRKYTPLVRYLETLPADQARVTLPFSALERLIGGPLPPTARIAAFWTSNRAVLRELHPAGWRATLPRAQTSVTFLRGATDRRRGPQPPRPRPPLLDHGAMGAAYQAGASVQAVAAQYGASRQTVYTVLRRAGIPLRGRH